MYEFRVIPFGVTNAPIPFGVTNAPAVFQRLMQQVLAGLQEGNVTDFVSVYLDDVIVFSETFTDHTKHLEVVFDHLKKAGLMLNPKKCRIVCNEVEYLGHVVTTQSEFGCGEEISSANQLETVTTIFGFNVILLSVCIQLC